MTGDWILRKNPSVDLKNLQPIKNRDGIVTVRIIGRATNNQVLIGQKVCDGRKVMGRVRDGRRRDDRAPQAALFGLEQWCRRHSEEVAVAPGARHGGRGRN